MMVRKPKVNAGASAWVIRRSVTLSSGRAASHGDRLLPMCCPTPEALPVPDPLHAIHGMPWRTPLLRALAAGQGQSTAARWAPLLSLAVPCSMP
jgi:hypothetical protein